VINEYDEFEKPSKPDELSSKKQNGENLPLPPPPPKKNSVDSKEKQGPAVARAEEDDVFVGVGVDYEVPGKDMSQSPISEDMEESPRNKERGPYFSEPIYGPVPPSDPSQDWHQMVSRIWLINFAGAYLHIHIERVKTLCVSPCQDSCQFGFLRFLMSCFLIGWFQNGYDAAQAQALGAAYHGEWQDYQYADQLAYTDPYLQQMQSYDQANVNVPQDPRFMTQEEKDRGLGSVFKRDDQRLQQLREKDAREKDPNFISESYSECYPGYQEYNHEIVESDDEADLSKMDMGGRVSAFPPFLNLAPVTSGPPGYPLTYWLLL